MLVKQSTSVYYGRIGHGRIGYTRIVQERNCPSKMLVNNQEPWAIKTYFLYQISSLNFRIRYLTTLKKKFTYIFIFFFPKNVRLRRKKKKKKKRYDNNAKQEDMASNKMLEVIAFCYEVIVGTGPSLPSHLFSWPLSMNRLVFPHFTRGSCLLLEQQKSIWLVIWQALKSISLNTYLINVKTKKNKPSP